MFILFLYGVVAISTKIQIWKQFTTASRPGHAAKRLLQSVQRYKFESNSQRNTLSYVRQKSCCNQYKDTNLKAIHNSFTNVVLKYGVVAISTKIQIWKQFTTAIVGYVDQQRLLQSVQRYKFESNSQRKRKTETNNNCCCNQYKDTNLKAIHNEDTDCALAAKVVAISTKIQIWKQFTTVLGLPPSRLALLQSVQRYKFESNSQLKQFGEFEKIVVAISTKIQIWKQFTTNKVWGFARDKLLQSVQRYKFESNSQRRSERLCGRGSCCNQYKDTNLKAIHNITPLSKVIWELLQSVQRYKFESNSQQASFYTLG